MSEGEKSGRRFNIWFYVNGEKDMGSGGCAQPTCCSHSHFLVAAVVADQVAHGELYGL